MPRRHRLTRADFKSFRPTRTLDGRYFSAKISQKITDMPPRVACVVSKKVFARANERNALRRRMRALVYKRIEGFPEGTDIVFLAKNNAKTASLGALRGDVDTLCDSLSSLPPMAERARAGYNK